MKHKAKEIAHIFNVSDQTVRNRVSQPEVAEFFSPEARRANGQYQAEFFADDIDVFNSIHTMLAQHATWPVIAEQLRSGWRDHNWPERAAHLKPPVPTPSNLEMATALAVTNDRNAQQAAQLVEFQQAIDALKQQLVTERQERDKLLGEKNQIIQEKDQAIHSLELRIEQIEKAFMVKAAKTEFELELYKSGRLKVDPQSE